MTLDWMYTSNQFDNATESSFKKMNLIAKDHLSKLAEQKTNFPEILVLHDRFAPIEHDYNAQYSAWKMALAFYKGGTQRLEDMLKQLSSDKIDEWDIKVQGVYRNKTAEYTTLFPDGRAPFQQGARDERITAVQTLAGALLQYPLLSVLQTEVQQYYTLFEQTRDAQQQLEQGAQEASSRLEELRKKTAVMMYRNLGILMDLFGNNPERITNFYQLDEIRRTGGSNTATDNEQDAAEVAPMDPPAQV